MTYLGKTKHIMINKIDSEKPDTNNEHKRSPNIKEKASTFWRFLWGSVGVVATLSGVLGVYQFFSEDNAKSAPLSSQEMIVAMVQNESISVEHATQLALVLAGDYSDQSTQTAKSIQEIAANGSEKQQEALQLLSQSHTRSEGLQILKEEATTFDDWQTVARLSRAHDEKLALLAIKNAIAINPQNFDALTTLAKLEADNSNYANAMRVVGTAELLAQNPYEKLLVSLALLDIANQAYDIEMMIQAIEQIKPNLQEYLASTEPENFPEKFAFNEFRIHPIWKKAEAEYAIATAYVFIDRDAVRKASLKITSAGNTIDYDKVYAENAKYTRPAIKYAGLAVSSYQTLLAHTDFAEQYVITKQILEAYSAGAVAHFMDGNIEQSVNLSSNTLELVRQYAESGDKGAINDLPKYYNNHANYLQQQKRFDEFLKTRKRSTELQTRFLKQNNPKDIELQIARLDLNYAIAKAMTGKADSIYSDIDAFFNILEREMMKQPNSDSILLEHPMTARRVSGLFINDRYGLKSKEDALRFFQRGEDIFATLKITNGPNHAIMHSLFYVFAYKGDINNSFFDKDDALKAYKQGAKMAPEIPPTEDEPDVVELMQLDILYRIGNLDVDESEQAIIDGVKLANKLNLNKQLTTNYQIVLNELKAMAKDRNIKLTSDN